MAKTLRRPWVRRVLWGAAITVGVVALAVGGLWWRLSSGPIELDVATPWLKAAIEKNFGGKQTVSVGGTQIERDENGRTSLRLRDIVVRDADGIMVASAPKAEVGISGTSLLAGNVRAESLNLVGAEMSVRIETDGQVTVFAGANKRPIATASAKLPVPPREQPAGVPPPGPVRAGTQDIAGVLSWIDGLGATGLDGHDLRELGLKNGNLIVDDQRNGKRWTFSKINISLTRPEQGGVIFRLSSDEPDRPWVLSAALRPLGDGVRAVGIEARHVSTKDILLALRMNEGDLDIDLPLSASVRAELSSDGTLHRLQGQVFAELRHRRRSRPQQSQFEDRPRRRALQLGRAAAGHDRSISDPVRRQSIHAARRAGNAGRAERRLAVQPDAQRSGDRPDHPGGGKF